MSVSVKPATAPINLAASVATLTGLAAWWLWPESGGAWQPSFAAWLLGSTAFVSTSVTASLLVKDYRLRRDLAKSRNVSQNHGTARQATWAEIVARDMHRPESGNLLGLFDGTYPVFAPPRTPFSLVEAPPGVGKTVAFVIPSILHRALLGSSLFIPDPKNELAPMLAPVLRQLGFDVWCVNPAGRHRDICPDTELNLYQGILDALYGDEDARSDTIKIASDLAELHLPEEGDARNRYFRNGSRRCIVVAILILALTDPARCTPSDAFTLMADPWTFLERITFVRESLDTGRKDDPVVAYLKGEAGNLIYRHKKNEENFASFIEGATQTLLAFNSGGRLAGYGREAVHNIAEMRHRQVITFVMSPLSHTRDFAPMVSLLNQGLLEACKRDPAGHPVHIVGEEALNYRFADLASDMETMRGLKVSMDLYIQSFAGLTRKYGQQAAASIASYCDVMVYAGLTSFDRAKQVSDMLAEGTIRTQDYSYQAVVKQIGVSSRETGRRLATADEVLAMPRDQAWVFVRGMRPLQLTMVPHWSVAPWSGWTLDNPIEGPRPRTRPLFTIEYLEGQKQ